MQAHDTACNNAEANCESPESFAMTHGMGVVLLIPSILAWTILGIVWLFTASHAPLAALLSAIAWIVAGLALFTLTLFRGDRALTWGRCFVWWSLVPAGFGVVYIADLIVPEKYKSPHRTDESLIHSFEEHRSEFDALATILEQLVRSPDSVLSDTISNQIDQLARTTGAVGSIENSSQGYCLPMSHSGLSITGSTKGYLFSRSPTCAQTSSIDNYRFPRETGYETVVLHLSGDWYLYKSVDW